MEEIFSSTASLRKIALKPQSFGRERWREMQ